jgi:MoaA/NifB/PqqE/SkfB family radical SAM enzyme
MANHERVSARVRDGIIRGTKAKFIRTCISLTILFLAIRQIRNPFTAYGILAGIKKRRRRVHGFTKITKYFKSQGRYFFSENIPGWPSDAFNAFIRGEILRLDRSYREHAPLHTVIFAITSRCPLQCKHCFEWNNISAKDSMSADDLKNILKKLQELGLHHIQLSGGEPLTRFEDLKSLLISAKKGIDFWLLTSGFGFTHEKAVLLKKAGLVGANISLDHWDADTHNEFRGNGKSFDWAREAVRNCKKARLVTCLSLCASRSFVSEENIWKFYDLAKEWGVGFVLILEPRAVGHFLHQDVSLKEDHIRILENFYQQGNASARYNNYPIIMYPGYHQRRVGCFGAGNRYLYIDSNGDIHACPFCQRKAGNAKYDSLIPVINRLRNAGCHEFLINTTD